MRSICVGGIELTVCMFVMFGVRKIQQLMK